jgi:hypothetical protein
MYIGGIERSKGFILEKDQIAGHISNVYSDGLTMTRALQNLFVAQYVKYPHNA